VASGIGDEERLAGRIGRCMRGGGRIEAGVKQGGTLGLVLMARSSALAPEPRVERAARCVASMGWKVVGVGWDREGRFPRWEERGSGFGILRVRARGQYAGGLRNLWGLFVYNCVLLATALRLRPRVFHAVDLDSAFPGLACKWLLGTKLVYDVADWYSASRPQSERLRKIRALWRLADVIENWVTSQADYVILPEESRRVFLRRSPEKWVIVYNAPEEGEIRELVESELVEKEENKGEYFVYMGSLYSDRGIEILCEAARRAQLPVVVGGSGPLEDLCRRAATESGGLIRFVGRLDYREALRVEARSIAVVALYDPRRAINRVAAPYKVYEAMALGKPVIVAEGTLLAELVRQRDCGVAVTYGEVEALVGAMRRLWEDRAEARRLGARGRELFQKELKYELQCAKLKKVYGELVGSAPVGQGSAGSVGVRENGSRTGE